MDVTMPRMDGITAARAILEDHPSTGRSSRSDVAARMGYWDLKLRNDTSHA
jgi:CheY-like chemotaxis protein